MLNKKRDMKKYLFKRGKEDKCDCKCHHHHASGSGIYFLGFIGAAVYYLQQSTSFWTGILAILKAIVWPAFLIYKLLGF
ncbi:Uncharacterised protein [uncultured archaeon]|nr:Uncharacterised protein [uncultured archaeon]